MLGWRTAVCTVWWQHRSHSCSEEGCTAWFHWYSHKSVLWLFTALYRETNCWLMCPRADLERLRFALASAEQLQWSSQLGCTTAVLLASLEQCQSTSAEELNQDVYPTIPTFLGSRKQGWEFRKNRLPAPCVARWTTKQALSERDWLVRSPGWPPTSPGAWKEWGRIAEKESILQKPRSICSRFFLFTWKFPWTG